MGRNATCIKVEGGLLPASFLSKLGKGEESRSLGLNPIAYHLEGARLHDAISASWNAMRGRWAAFVAALAKTPETDPTTSLTRERWLLPLFAELQYGRLVPDKAREIDGTEYPIPYHWQNSPIHFVGFRVPLDRRSPGVQGAARTAPHSLVQDYLNRTPGALWGFLSNGKTLRILRDNKSLARPSFIEFDLAAMFEDEAYSDFVVLWLLCHQSRVETKDPHQCWLEQWVNLSQKEGTRALDKLRFGIKIALTELGQGFLEEPTNRALREALASENLAALEYYRQVIRVVYRLMFLFTAEDRDLLFPSDCDPAAKETYLRFYSATRLRDMAAKIFGTRHGDLWEGLSMVFSKLSVEGCPALALPALNSFLWDPKSAWALNDAALPNHRLLSAVRNLTYLTEGTSRQRIDYRNLGAEEIGGIYENIIALSPLLDLDSRTFKLGEGAFSEKDQTASHYTPACLVDELLNSALDPVLDRACKEKDPAAAILKLKVCDRACGSGHFLVAAAKRMAKRLAAVRTEEAEPAPEAIQKALRDVISHCIYGVDLNPTAVELCKFSLWLESMDHGRPLSFLENRIKTGNSLLGVTPAAIEAGIADEAFAVLTDDEKTVVSALKKQNRNERLDLEQGQATLSSGEILWTGWVDVRDGAKRIIDIDDDEISQIHWKQAEYEKLLASNSYLDQKLIADAWCAAFVLPRVKGAPQITAAIFEELKQNPASCPPKLRTTIGEAAAAYRFFHWHLEFPEVYSLLQTGENLDNALYGWSGGFDVNLGNPPWDRIKLQEKEWFAERVPEIAKAPNAAKRKELIEQLKTEQPVLFEQFKAALRKADGESHLLRNSGLYPLCGRGDINLYAVFAEANRNHLAPDGLMGLVIPSNIATDDTTKFFFQDVIKRRSLVSLFDFENKGLFPGVHNSYKFCLFTSGGQGAAAASETTFVFFAHSAADLHDPERRVTLSKEDIALINPNTGTCPVFRSRADAELTKAIYRCVPVLIKEGDQQENPWGVSFKTMFHMANDSHLFRTCAELTASGWELDGNVFRRGGEEYLPLYEQNLIHIDTHRFASFRSSAGKIRPDRSDYLTPERLAYADELTIPRYWVHADEVSRIRQVKQLSSRYYFAFRRSVRSTDARTMLFCAIPNYAIGDSIFLITPPSDATGAFLAMFNRFVFDFIARQSIGGENASFFIIKQLPTLTPTNLVQRCLWSGGTESVGDWVLPRVLELTYTAWDLEMFAKDCDYDGPPFRWDEVRRFLLRCELDAAFLHLYLGTAKEWQRQPQSLTAAFPAPQHAVHHIMETFPIVKENDIKAYGTYRTKDTILKIYDAMALAVESGKPYQTLLDPPPADSRVAHAPRDAQVAVTA
jgi:hypothetical protein